MGERERRINTFDKHPKFSMRRHEPTDHHRAKHDPSRNAANLHAHEMEWPDLPPSCTSQNRCSLISCERCARRYSARVARRILATSPRNLFAIEIDAALPSFAAFWRWRVEVRNWLDHRRRASRYWKSVGLYAWFSQDSLVRGIITLDAVTKDEVETALGRRWSIAVRGINHADLNHQIYAAVRPNVIWNCGPVQSRYQSRKLAIWPSGEPILSEPRLSPRENNFIEPMPILI